MTAVREFIHAITHEARDSAKPFILEDSVEPSHGPVDWCLRDVQIFTTEDREQIKLLRGRPCFQVWTRNLAPSARLISQDTIRALFSTKHLEGWTYFYDHYGPDFHSLGCPLFLRNYTWCLIYSTDNCGGLCGSGQLTLYRKVGDKWILVKNWEDWVS